jgi:hypothetical protein
VIPCAIGANLDFPDLTAATLRRGCVDRIVVKLSLSENQTGYGRHAFRDQNYRSRLRIKTENLSGAVGV